MLQKLYIQNYAIIDEINISFSSKLNIITGETGAGKSILMGALSLILGERADSSVLMNQQKKCFIEGIFSIDGKKEIKDFLTANEFDETDELVLRREITANGKSRSFINDTPATLQQLKQLASLLVDLHQQFDTLELSNSNFQREVVDALANHQNKIQSYQNIYKQWLQSKTVLKELIQQKNAFTKEADYHQFLFDELNELNLKENELEDLDDELKLLTNSEGIKITLSKIYFDLKESEQPIVVLLKQIVNQLQHYAELHHALPTIVERLQSSQIELNDIASEIDSINNSVHFDEAKIALINEKLAAGYKLLKKHGVQHTNELISIQADLEKKLQAVLHIDDAIAAKEKETIQLLKQAQELASAISANRKKQINPLEAKVNALLVQVGMPNARIKIEITDTVLNEFGKDNIEFLFDANKNNKFESIKKVASGGELSRLMLSIKSLVAQSIDLATMIFDEIDTGISGEAAKQVGLIMKGLAINRQIICITHQPQIAGKADAHFFVYKQTVNDTVKTSIRLLNKDERITSIAQMLGGEKPTAAALENAREMIMN
jgi:DNA repair protein RecN (Recombination protein N)